MDGVIDLDLARHEEPSTREPVRFPVRPVLAGLSLLLVLLLGGAAYRKPFDRPLIIPAGLADTTFVDNDRLFVVRQPGVIGGEQILDTYHLPDGRQLGHALVDVSASVADVIGAGDTVLLTYMDSAAGSEQQTVAYSLAGGRELWQRQGSPAAASIRTGLALLYTGLGGPGDGGIAVDLRTGAQRWQVTSPNDTTMSTAGWDDGMPDWIVSVGLGGHVEVRDPRTGEVTASADLPTPTQLVGATADQILLTSGDQGISDYTLPDLRRRWTDTGGPGEQWMVIDCATVLCSLHRPQSLTVIDPTTGKKLWADDRWAFAQYSDGHLLASPTDGTLDTEQLFILDPATGKVLGGFGDWHAVLSTDGSGLRYGTHVADGDPAAMWFGSLSPATGQATIIGYADQVSGQCEIGSGALVCRRLDASVGVWQLR